MEELTKKCEQCGVIFDKPRSLSKTKWVDRRFCTMNCSLLITGIKKGKPLPKEWVDKMIGRPSPNKNNPNAASGNRCHNWKGGMVTKYCQVCNAQFEVIPKRKETAKFCSSKCKNIAQDNGISTENEKIRRSKQYKEWRTAVFERDNYTCQLCGARGGNLNADHIKPFALYKELRFKLNNGRTLCTNCHKSTPMFGGKMISYIKGF